jgi:hypothetical protein
MSVGKVGNPGMIATSHCKPTRGREINETPTPDLREKITLLQAGWLKMAINLENRNIAVSLFTCLFIYK